MRAEDETGAENRTSLGFIGILTYYKYRVLLIVAVLFFISRIPVVSWANNTDVCLYVKVYDVLSNNPVSGASILIVNEWTSDRHEVRAVTDQFGEARLDFKAYSHGTAIFGIVKAVIHFDRISAEVDHPGYIPRKLALRDYFHDSVHVKSNNVLHIDVRLKRKPAD